MEEKVVVKRPPKSPGLAGVLAFFFPFGVGPLYNGQYSKALVHFLIFSGLVTLMTTGEGQPFLGLCMAGFLFYQLIDSVQVAKNINRKALTGEEMEPDIEEIPQMIKSGSIFWGAALMFLGGILLLANFEIIDYDTLWDLWPVAVIVLGIKLIADYYARDKQEEKGE